MMPTVARPLTLPPIWASLLGFALLTWWSRGVYTVDMQEFLLPWFAHIRATGPIAAFAQPFSNYTPPYLYILAAASPLAGVMTPPALIKLLSVAGNLVLAGAVRHLLVRLGAAQPSRAAALILLVPSVFANAALLHQCDALWSAAIVMALAAGIDRRYRIMFVWCGVGFAFKAQAALVGPFFLAFALARGVPMRTWLWAPVAAIVPMLPAALMGWPIWDLATIYLRQAQYADELSLNAPNIWAVVQALAGPLASQLGGLAFVTAIGAMAWYVAYFSDRLRRATPVELVAAAALATMLTVGLLPRMHERYFFLADVLTAMLVLLGAGGWRLGACTQLGSCLAIMAYLMGVPTPSAIMLQGGAVAMLVATWLVARPLLTRPANDNAATAGLAIAR